MKPDVIDLVSSQLAGFQPKLEHWNQDVIDLVWPSYMLSVEGACNRGATNDFPLLKKCLARDVLHTLCAFPF